MLDEKLLKEAKVKMDEFLNIMSKIMGEKVIGIPKEFNVRTDEDLKRFIEMMQLDYWKERTKNL